MNRLALGIVCGLALAGCATPAQMFVNPQGQVMRCSASGWGYIGAPLANRSFDSCVDDLSSLGYVKIENVGVIGILLSRSDTSPPLVQVVTPNSPAAVAGMLPGDELFEVDGHAVFSGPSALQALFGGVGQPVNVKYRRAGREFQVTLVRTSRLKSPS